MGKDRFRMSGKCHWKSTGLRGLQQLVYQSGKEEEEVELKGKARTRIKKGEYGANKKRRK